MPPHSSEELFLDHFGEQALRGFTKAVFTAHASATALAYSEFAEPEADNVVGFLRRAKLEGLLRDVAEVAGLDAEVIRSDSPWNHVEVRSGRVILTESAVQTPLEMVVKSDFRMGLAQMQPSLLDLLNEEETAAEDAERSLYALLLHTRSQWDNGEERSAYRHLPGSIYLAFPDRSLDYYVHYINLFERYPDIVAANTPQEWNTEALVRYVHRSRRFGTA